MAFRLGYQISCNLHNNVLTRCHRRFRSLSPCCFYGQLKEDQRRRPRSSSDDLRASPKTLQNYRNFSRIRSDDDQEAQNHPDIDKPYFNVAKIRKGPITHELQPKYINPVATVNINFSNFAPLEDKPPHTEKFLILRKQAQAQYSKAVEGLSKKDEDVSYRYQLEAANPKTLGEKDILSAVDVKKKLQHAVSTVIPQLQPKNIKPFGNLTTQWRAPNLERMKQGLQVVYQNQYEGPHAVIKKTDSDRDIGKSLSTIQQRSYSTAQGANDLEAEHERLVDPDHTDKDLPEIGANDSLRNLETKENKRQNSRYMLYMSRGSVYSKRIPSSFYGGDFKSAIFNRPKVHSDPITVKIGPKWKLQSAGIADAIESEEPLIPKHNEKFSVPWPSYSDSIKTTNKGSRSLAPVADVNDVSSALKYKYDAMFNKIQSDTNTLLLKSQPELGNPNFTNREYSTGLRRNEVGKEQRFFLNIRKSRDYAEVLSKISAIQEKRYARHKGFPIKMAMRPESNVSQMMMNVPISNPKINLPIVHHVGKAVSAKVSRETLFKHMRSKLRQRAERSQQRDSVFARTRGGMMFSQLKSGVNNTPVMTFSTLSTRIQQPGHQDARSVYVEKMCCPPTADESLRSVRCYLQSLNEPDRPQVREKIFDESQLKSKQNLRLLNNTEESKTASTLATAWAKVAEYFGFLNGLKVLCFGGEAERSGCGRNLTGNFLNLSEKYLHSVASRNYSNFSKFEARRKRKKKAVCPCIQKKSVKASQPVFKRLPKHPPMERTAYKCDAVSICADLGSLRSDAIAGVADAKRKSLPKLQIGDCPPPQSSKSDERQTMLKRLPKIIFIDRMWKCPGNVCDDSEKYRADRHLNLTEKKTLPVLKPGNCPNLEIQRPKMSAPVLKRLSKPPLIDRPPYNCEVPCVDLRLFRSDIIAKITDVKPKSLPKLIVDDCPPPAKSKSSAPQPTFKRLPKPPFEDHVWECRGADECQEYEMYRADRGVDLYKKKSLPVLKPGTCPLEEADEFCIPEPKGKASPVFQNSNRQFSTTPYHFDGRRFFSTNSQKGSEKKECKKLDKIAKNDGKKQCKQLRVVNCEPAKSFSCDRKLARAPCKKTHSPYPAFSECKEDDAVPPLAECDKTQKHLQPKWPIITNLFTLQTPPPKQGKIDPSKEEECVMRKLNLQRDGTKTCDNFHEPAKTFKAKELLAKHKKEESEDGRKAKDETKESSLEDVCVKPTKSKAAELSGVKPEPPLPILNEESAKQEKPPPPPPREEELSDQAHVKTIKSPKLTPKDICALTKKKTSRKPKKKSSLFGFSRRGKSKAKPKKKAPVTVSCPPKGFFRRIMEFFFGKPSRPKPLLIEKSGKKAPSTQQLCMKGASSKTKPVFNYSSPTKKKPKKKDVSKTSESKPAPKITKAAVCPDEVETKKPSETAEIKKPQHKIADVTMAVLCPDETKKEQTPGKDGAHKIAEITKASLCPDEVESDPKKGDSKPAEKEEPKHKIAVVTKVLLCPDEREVETEEKPKESGEESKAKNQKGKAKSKIGSGKCRLTPYGNCPGKARENCEVDFKYPPCKPKEPPYFSFSECHKNFPKLPLSECREQEKRFTQQAIELELLSKEHKKKE